MNVKEEEEEEETQMMRNGSKKEFGVLVLTVIIKAVGVGDPLMAVMAVVEGQ